MAEITVEQVLIAYGRAMQRAQAFEGGLQAIAAMELADLTGDLTLEERVARTEGFYSRGVHWIQQRLDLSVELATEIEALRHARNDLAHQYLQRHDLFGFGTNLFGFGTADQERRQREYDLESKLPERLQREAAEYEEERDAETAQARSQAIDELAQLERRFSDCYSVLTDRFMGNLGVPFASNWEEVEQNVREKGGTFVDLETLFDHLEPPE
jgi:hypothetical protein